MTKTHTLADSDTTFEFDGVKLASASSHAPGKNRWAEITVFRTDGGQYVAHGVGRTTLAGETDRCWVSVAVDADALVTILTRQSNGVLFMPNVNKRVLQLAGVNDADIALSYRHQFID